MIAVEIDSAQIDELRGRVSELASIPLEPILRVAGDMAYARLMELAHERLDSSRDRYIEGVLPPEVSSDSVRIRLEGFAAMTEEGYPPFDMRDTLLGPDQEYRVIRFRQKWPEAGWGKGRGFGTPAGKHRFDNLPKEAATKLGRAMLRELKKRPLDQRVSTRAGRVRRYSKPILEEEAGPRLRKHHASPLYAGLRAEKIRKNQVGPSGKDVEYAIYRTVSRNSGSGWYHPGYQGANLLPEAAAVVDEATEELLVGVMNTLLG